MDMGRGARAMNARSNPTDHDDLVAMKAEVRWHRYLLIAIIGSVWLTHFIDPSHHWWVFVFP